jgi:hypothetical protein
MGHITRCVAFALLLFVAPLAMATKLVEVGAPYVAKSGGYQIQFPVGWRWEKCGADSSATRDGYDLDVIYVSFFKHKNAFTAIKQSSTADMAPQDLAEDVIAEFKAVRGLENIDTLSNEPVLLGGQPAFRLHLKFRTPIQAGALSYEEIVIGSVTPTGVLLVGYRGPSLHYFGAYLPAFEEALSTYQFLPVSARKP